MGFAPRAAPTARRPAKRDPEGDKRDTGVDGDAVEASQAASCDGGVLRSWHHADVAAAARADGASLPATTRPRAGKGVLLRRGGGFEHGDNTGGALRFAPSLSHSGVGHEHRGAPPPPPPSAAPTGPGSMQQPPSGQAGHPGARAGKGGALGDADLHVRGAAAPNARPDAAAAPAKGQRADFASHRLAHALPLHLLPLLSSLPAARNNLRHAQRTVGWWRTFHARDRRLAARARALGGLADRRPPGGVALGDAAGVDATKGWAKALGRWRDGCARERRGVRVALREAHFGLAFNAVELGTYLAGAVPLLTPATAGALAQAGATLAVRAVPPLLFASGLLHVAQQAGWLRWMLVARRAAATASLPEPLRGALQADLCAGRTAHAVQLGLWVGFCVGLVGAGGALVCLGLGPLLGGTLTAASMLASRAHRMASPRRLEVPEHAVWRRATGQGGAAGSHHAAVFGDVAAQAAAWLRLQAQEAAAATLRRELVRASTPSGWGALWRLLLAMPTLPGTTTLLGAVGGRALAGRSVALTRAALALQREIWCAQAAACAEAQARAERDVAAWSSAPSDADAVGRRFVAERKLAGHHVARQAAHERRRLEALGQRAQVWAAGGGVGEWDAWDALGGRGGPCSDAGGDGARLVGAYLVATEAWLRDVRGALLWGAALGVAASRSA